MQSIATGDERNRITEARRRWRCAQRRYDRLLAVFADQKCLAAALDAGRLLHLCSLAATASQLAEQRRQALAALIEVRGPLH